MAANETMIEASLASMREGLGEVRAELREQRADIKTIRERLEQKTEATHQSHLALIARMDQGFAACNSRIEAVNTALNTKMDQGFAACNSKIEAVNTALSAKIDVVTQGIADLRGMQKAMFWVFGVVGSLVAIAGTVVAIGKALHWF